MKLAIMQPYIFPYIGYYQLINLVDKFIIYDDVNFIKKGWINRNNILVNQKPNLFTVPLSKQSQNALIKDTIVNEDEYTKWKNKFLKTINAAYKKAPYYEGVFSLVHDVLSEPTNSIADLSRSSLISVCNYLKINTEIIYSSSIYNNNILSGQERIADICIKEKATNYINPIGGLELYDKGAFKAINVELSFIKSVGVLYTQFKEPFVPWLSVIDVLMFNSPEEVNEMMYKYELV